MSARTIRFFTDVLTGLRLAVVVKADGTLSYEVQLEEEEVAESSEEPHRHRMMASVHYALKSFDKEVAQPQPEEAQILFKLNQQASENTGVMIDHGLLKTRQELST
jgi:hypothetical protein